MNFLINEHLFSREITNYSIDDKLNLIIYLKTGDPAKNEHVVFSKPEISHILLALLKLFDWSLWRFIMNFCFRDNYFIDKISSILLLPDNSVFIRFKHPNIYKMETLIIEFVELQKIFEMYYPPFHKRVFYHIYSYLFKLLHVH